MSNDLKAEYIAILRERYQKLGKKEKGQLLTQLCENTGLSRKHGIRALNKKAGKNRKSPGRNKDQSFFLVAFCFFLIEFYETMYRFS